MSAYLLPMQKEISCGWQSLQNGRSGLCSPHSGSSGIAQYRRHCICSIRHRPCVYGVPLCNQLHLYSHRSPIPSNVQSRLLCRWGLILFYSLLFETVLSILPNSAHTCNTARFFAQYSARRAVQAPAVEIATRHLCPLRSISEPPSPPHQSTERASTSFFT